MKPQTLPKARFEQPRVVMRRGRLVSNAQTPIAATSEQEPVQPPVAPKPKVGKFGRLMVVLFVITIFLPNNYPAGSLNVTPNLALLALGFLPLLGLLLVGKAGKMSGPDWLILILAIWSAATRIYLLGAESIEPLGLNLLQTLSAYMFGRVLVRDLETTRRAFATALIGIMIMFYPLLWEALTGQKLLLWFTSLFGPTIPPTYMDPRWGFQRAQGVFDHPILLGIFCASMVSISVYAFYGTKRRFLRLFGPTAAVIAGVTTFSSGALLSMNIQFGLMLWGYLFRFVKNRWAILMWLLAAMYITVDSLSDRTPFHVFIDYATFNQQSSYNRILIWKYGSAAVMEHPFIGHGGSDWTRPSYMSDSMDNFWLVIAYRYGLPAFAMLAGACIWILTSISNREGPTVELDKMRRGAIFSIVGTMVAIVSVHLWNNSYVWFMFMLGAISWMGRRDSEQAEQAPPPGSDSTGKRQSLRSRAFA